MRSDENYVKNTDGEDLDGYTFYNIVSTEEINGKHYIKLEDPFHVKFINGKMAYGVMTVDLDQATNVPFKILNLGEK